MTTHNDERSEELSNVTTVGDGGQERVDGIVPLMSGCNNPPEKDCGDPIEPINVASSDAQTEIESEDLIIETIKAMKIPANELVIYRLFQHFEKEIRDIIQRCNHETSTEKFIWKVFEECYKEAVSASGTLNAHDFVDHLKDSSWIWFLDPDFASQDHAGHYKGERSWVYFWVTILELPSVGPTLFYPQNSSDIDLSSPNTTPPYLFRVFDWKSSGKNDEEVMASSEYASQTQTSVVNDLLDMENLKATRLLSYHIGDKWTRKNDDQDNLVSWTNSLLYAVQYATYRQHRLSLLNTDIKICMVQTSQFPQGQFVRDIELLKKYLPIANNLGGEVKRVFNRRLCKQEFYNGEYFSQGVVNHAGRSCIVSLKQLEDAGIFRLYPELKNPKDSSGYIRNAIRVCDLRREWSEEQTTTEEEISYALNIAQECFEGFDASDIACILLGFRNRKLSDKTKLTINSAPSWANKPVEVGRYWQALDIFKHLQENLGHNLEMRNIYRVTSSGNRIISRLQK